MSDKNGSNPRLDRIERIIEGLGKAHEQFQSDLVASHAQFKREMAEHRAETKREMAEHRAETKRDMGLVRLELRRWAALGVKEARRQRSRQREFDLNITRLAAAQLVTEEKLTNFIASLGRGGNGGGRKSE
jgi:hypothetical protein